MIMDVGNPGPSLFERSGGFGRVSRIVMDFYERVLDSEGLAPWFETVDMRALIEHQTKFVASLMGGPASYTDETLRRVHARLGVTRAAFDEMKALMAESLEDNGMAEDDVDAVLQEIERCAPLIVTA
jgi:hemoglobin